MSSTFAAILPPVRFQNLKVYPRKRLRRDPKSRLPVPHVPVTVRQYAPSRWEDHYHDTLKDDLMYMTYVHERGPRPPPRFIRPTYDPEDPFTKGRKNNPPVGGDRSGRKLLPPDSPDNIIKLESIKLHIMEKTAVSSRQNLLGPIMALRALSGETQFGGGHHKVQGVEITRGKKVVGSWIRPKVPVGAKVELKGQSMWDFLGTLSEFVLPRMRDFNGFTMTSPSANPHSASAVSGVVSFGLPPTAMGFFPQIEVNQDAYPKMYGMYIHFVTNANGVGAQNRARALVSGLQVPFLRR